MRVKIKRMVAGIVSKLKCHHRSVLQPGTHGIPDGIGSRFIPQIPRGGPMKHLHVIQLCRLIGNSKAGLSFISGLGSF